MDDIKLYASKKNHILSLLTITENVSNDIWCDSVLKFTNIAV
jgi:hypothetical protein